MTPELVEKALFWCTLFNVALLLLGSIVCRVARDRVHKISSWFRLSAEQFDSLWFTGLIHYKIGILLFNLVPFIALFLARR